jgi:hypothetical protein
VKDEVSLMGENDVELTPSAVAAPLTPNEKVELEDEELDVETLEIDEMVELDDDEFVLVATIRVEVGVVPVLVAISEVEIELELEEVKEGAKEVEVELEVEEEEVTAVEELIVDAFDPRYTIAPTDATRIITTIITTTTIVPIPRFCSKR